MAMLCRRASSKVRTEGFSGIRCSLATLFNSLLDSFPTLWFFIFLFVEKICSF